MKAIRITAKKDGYRRCGVPHPAEATWHSMDAFDKDQLKILKAEPMLVVEEVEKNETPIEGKTVPELKELLGELNVTYPHNARKEDLAALAKEKTENPPEV